LSVTQILREDDLRTLRFIEYFNYLHDLPAISEDNEFFSVTSTNNSSSSRSNPSSRSTDVDMSHILPTEILYMLASYFEPRDCISLLRVNKIFNQIYDESSIWRSFCIHRGLLEPFAPSSMTTHEYKLAIFTSHWTFTFKERIIVKKVEHTMVYTFNVIPAEIYRKTYAREKEPLIVVVDMSKYDLQLTEPDGTKIQYFDKCKKFIEEIVTRPHGPITREQLHFWKDPDFSPTDRYQPLFSPAVVVILIGARDLENRLNRGDEFPAVFGPPVVESLNSFLFHYLVPTNSPAFVWSQQTNATFRTVCELVRSVANSRAINARHYY
jgi:hypothetical protein